MLSDFQSMSDVDDVIPPANTPSEVNIHLGYIRRDIRELGTAIAAGLKRVDEQVGGLDDHYVSRAEFSPVAEQTKKNTADLEEIKTFRDNLTGKLFGFGSGISVATAALTFALTYLFGH